MNIAFSAIGTEEGQKALAGLVARYGDSPLEEAEALVCLGGDGFMLETLRGHDRREIPVFGLNYGTVGFLMNQPDESHLPQRLANAQRAVICPLHMRAVTVDGAVHEAFGFNDVFIYRQTRQTVRVSIEVDGRLRIPQLVGDGVIVATPAGSTAYNRSSHGPIIPLGAELLALTPIGPFHPRHWRGALLPGDVVLRFVLSDTEKRPASAVAGGTEIRNVAEVVVRVDHKREVTLLFDPDHSLSERIIAEQFTG